MPARQPHPVDADPFEELADKISGMDPEIRVRWLSSLSPQDMAIAQTAIARRTGLGWRASPGAMMEHLTDGRLVNYRYVQLLSHKFREAVDGTSTRQIWSLPSRIGKTTFIQWCLAQSFADTPRARWMYLAYGDLLAMETGEAVKSLLLEHAEVLGITLRKDVARKDRFKTDQGGGLLCRGIGSGIIGFGAGDGGGIFLDDPMRSWQDAHSETARAKVMGAYTGVIRHRIDQETAPIIVVHARWHRQDISGQLIESMESGTGERWDVTALPALAHDPSDFDPERPPAPDPLGRQPGEPIEPERFTAADVRLRHVGLMSSYVVAAIEQQNPLADEGVDLKREWFQLVEPSEIPLMPERAITSWDLKLKDTETGDYVVGQVWWRVGKAYWLVDQIRGTYDHATTQNAIALLAVRHPLALTHHIEAAGHAPEAVKALRQPQADYSISDPMAVALGMTPTDREAVQALRRSGMGNLHTHKPEGDKRVRARTYIVPAAEAGNVRLPKLAPWLAPLLDELAGFGGGAEHDDQVDAMSQALKILTTGEGAISLPGGRTARPRTGRKLARPTPG